jgi:hypothetical protein
MGDAASQRESQIASVRGLFGRCDAVDDDHPLVVIRRRSAAGAEDLRERARFIALQHFPLWRRHVGAEVVEVASGEVLLPCDEEEVPRRVPDDPAHLRQDDALA